MKSAFQAVSTSLFNELLSDENLTLSLHGEDVEYLRFNQSKIRQMTRVCDAELSLDFQLGNKRMTASTQLKGDNPTELIELLKDMRKKVQGLPDDPFTVSPLRGESSDESFEANLPYAEDVVESLLRPCAHVDLVGVHQSGNTFKAVANSAGLSHWFATDSFATDYSLFHPNGKAVKGSFAGTEWQREAHLQKIERQKEVLHRLERPARQLAPAHYRVYMEPAATADLIAMFSYFGVSESAIRQGESALIKLVNGSKRFSGKFRLTENFSSGRVPRFNEFGELAPESLTIIEDGRLSHSLISPRTAKEYGLESNGASSWEGLRSPEMAPGNLAPTDALKSLGTGVYLSNLHYLNWSDVQGARVTGMTRYACMWVENGEFVAPILDMRFDDSLYDIFGHKLESCTNTSELSPAVGSYGGKEIGGIVAPGIILNDFALTL